jgi:hypothetical protein
LPGEAAAVPKPSAAEVDLERELASLSRSLPIAARSVSEVVGVDREQAAEHMEYRLKPGSISHRLGRSVMSPTRVSAKISFDAVMKPAGFRQAEFVGPASSSLCEVADTFIGRPRWCPS